MSQILSMAQFIRIRLLNNTSVLINIKQITAVEEMAGHDVLRIHVSGHTYETNSSLDDLLLILGRTATISRL